MRLLTLALAVLVGCTVNQDPSIVICEEDAHCPSGWWCPGTPEEPATCEEGVRPDDDDDLSPGDDDDTGPADDDDSTADDDDSTPMIAAMPPPPGGLCSTPGTTTSDSFTVHHCTGPTLAVPGLSSSPSFTVVMGASRLMQTPE